MKTIPSLTTAKYCALSIFIIPSLAFAQTGTSNLTLQDLDDFYNKATSDREFTLELSDELARCHGIQYEMHDFLTQKIEMNIDNIKMEINVSQGAQMAGYVAVFLRTLHSDNVAQSYQYANIISGDARSEWKAKLRGATGNPTDFALARLVECQNHAPIVEALFGDALAQKSR